METKISLALLILIIEKFDLEDMAAYETGCIMFWSVPLKTKEIVIFDTFSHHLRRSSVSPLSFELFPRG
jgi:hypothetical protein